MHSLRLCLWILGHPGRHHGPPAADQHPGLSASRGCRRPARAASAIADQIAAIADAPERAPAGRNWTACRCAGATTRPPARADELRANRFRANRSPVHQRGTASPRQSGQTTSTERVGPRPGESGPPTPWNRSIRTPPASARSTASEPATTRLRERPSASSRGDREHGERQERHQQPRARRPAAGPLRVAQVHERRPRPRPRSETDRQAEPAPSPSRTPPARQRQQQDRGVEEEPAIAAPEQGADAGSSRAAQARAGSRGCGPWRNRPSRGGSSPCPRASRRRAGCSRAGASVGISRPDAEAGQGVAAGAARPGTGPAGRGRGSPRPARPGAR